MNNEISKLAFITGEMIGMLLRPNTDLLKHLADRDFSQVEVDGLVRQLNKLAEVFYR